MSWRRKNRILFYFFQNNTIPASVMLEPLILRISNCDQVTWACGSSFIHPEVENPGSKIKRPPQYIGICWLAQFFSQEAEPMSEISWLEFWAEETHGRTWTFTPLQTFRTKILDYSVGGGILSKPTGYFAVKIFPFFTVMEVPYVHLRHLCLRLSPVRFKSTAVETPVSQKTNEMNVCKWWNACHVKHNVFLLKV